MNGPFKVGEIVVGQNHVISPEYNGMEAEVIYGLQIRDWVTDRGVTGSGYVYVVKWATGEVCAADPINLRRKQPPKREIDTVVSWENCAWRPVKTGVAA